MNATGFIFVRYSSTWLTYQPVGSAALRGVLVLR